VHLARTQLQSAADAAARAGAASLADHPGDVAAASAAATAVAAMNDADRPPVALQASEVEVGNWDDQTNPHFAGWPNSVDAVRVIAHRDQTRGNAVSLSFARVLGRDTWGRVASSIARIDPQASPYGIVGIDRMSFASIGAAAQIDGRVVEQRRRECRITARAPGEGERRRPFICRHCATRAARPYYRIHGPTLPAAGLPVGAIAVVERQRTHRFPTDRPG